MPELKRGGEGSSGGVGGEFRLRFRAGGARNREWGRKLSKEEEIRG